MQDGEVRKRYIGLTTTRREHLVVTTKPIPMPSPEAQRYWEGAQVGELWIQRCLTTGKPFFPPRIYSPFTIGGEVEWFQASGNATLYSYVINHRPAPGFEEDAPYAIAVVELEEGPRMMTNIVDIANTPENLLLGMDLRVRFEPRGSQSVPVFGPAETAAS
jgi:hypothetical protein